jgi:hypothetical protein
MGDIHGYPQFEKTAKTGMQLLFLEQVDFSGDLQ